MYSGCAGVACLLQGVWYNHDDSRIDHTVWFFPTYHVDRDDIVLKPQEVKPTENNTSETNTYLLKDQLVLHLCVFDSILFNLVTNILLLDL